MRMPPRGIANILANLAVTAVVTCLCLATLELAFRLIDGYRIDQIRLVPREGRSTEPAEASLHYAEQLILDPSFSASWYLTSPVDYDRSPKYPVPSDWKDAVENYRASHSERAFVKDELKFLYNYNWLVEACETGNHSNIIKYYKRFPGFVYAFISSDGSPNPPYRILPRGWPRGQDYYNNFGFRGPDISPHKFERVIRLAFLGASTTANGWPFTYPEYVAHFLRLWAKINKFDVDFDVINAGRGGTDLPIIASIMRYEVAPLHPDIVVYYEGANDFHADSVVRMPDVNALPPYNTSVLRSSMRLKYLPLEQYSALMERVYALLFRRSGLSAEPPKPPHTLTYNLKQADPDIERHDLPFHLHRQIIDLRDMANAAGKIGAEFFLTSFVTLVHDGLLLDPERHRIILQGLNGEYFPMTYAEIREAVNFENAVYRKLARTDHHPFLDVNRYVPQDPVFFSDMVHFSKSGGFRLQGWIVAQLLAPYIRAAIESGKLPKPAYDPDAKAIAWAAEPPIKFDLSCLP